MENCSTENVTKNQETTTNAKILQPSRNLANLLECNGGGSNVWRNEGGRETNKQHISSIHFVSETKDNSALTALGASLGHSSMSSGPAVVVSTTLPLVGGSNTYTDDIAAYCKEFSSFFFLFHPRCKCDEKVQQAAIRQHPHILHP